MTNNNSCIIVFVQGKPAQLEDETNIDWVPSVNLGYCKYSDKFIKSATSRQARTNKRVQAKGKQKAHHNSFAVLHLLMCHTLLMNRLVN